ncbi:chemotaxis protein CheB [Myxococcota bacterium]|nr:chemotaxis protein CheB [Myxococcota bacterium]MBU1379425.1 chemotaxis protein CheB [Myxococcota bacterium]MBU1497628.1 chemotaxis protein CheB [Myxococcota bacterium]
MESPFLEKKITEVIQELDSEVQIITLYRSFLEKDLTADSPALLITDKSSDLRSAVNIVRETHAVYPWYEVFIFTDLRDDFTDFLEKMLAAGAMDCAQLPSDSSSWGTILRRVIRPLLGLTRMRHTAGESKASILRENYRNRRTGKFRALTVPVSVLPILKNTPFKLVVIGISTGGPAALNQVLPKLPADMNVPVIIVQHIPHGFTDQMARGLDRKCAINVREGKNGEHILPGYCYIVPGGIHSKILFIGDHMVLRTVMSDPVNSCRPSVDFMLKSLDRMAKSSVIVVIMTGMGEDGVAEAINLKNSGISWNIAQDEKSCTVFGMPKVLIDRGGADEIISMELIADALTRKLGIKQ